MADASMMDETASMDKARVAIVDDSRSIRRWLRVLLETDDRFDVVAEASSAREAREVLRHVPVDVLTLDVDMPGMSGLEFLARLMVGKPMPVVMLSALTERGSREAIEAMSLGAVDCIEKPRSIPVARVQNAIRDRIWQASRTHVGPQGPTNAPHSALPALSNEFPWSGPVILLGASTGGVNVLETILAELDGVNCPVVIAQHMPENFLRSFCRRLEELFARRFMVARDGAVLHSGQGVLALGKDVSTRLVRGPGGTICLRLGRPSDGANYRPSVDDLFLSAADAKLGGAAALLTGMGADGAAGLKALAQRDWPTFAQDQSSSVVFGMPRAAIENRAAKEVLSPSEIGRKLAIFASQIDSQHKQGLT